ncbi:MAG: M50 family metallopeptidase [Conexivisphaerales archaeon]
MQIVMYLISILSILFLAGIHELGHGLVASLLGLPVSYGLGMGKIIYQKGRFTLRLFPIAAYVDIPESLLDSLKAWKRNLIVIAGPLVNLIIAIAILSGIFTCIGYNTLNTNMGTITMVNNNPVLLPEQITLIEKFSPPPYSITFADGRVITVQDTSNITFIRDFNIFGAVKHALLFLIVITKFTFISLVRDPAHSIAGPVGVVNILSSSTSPILFLFLLGVISFSLFLLNILPLLPLDGGWIVVYTLEGILDRQMNSFRKVYYAIGMSFFVLLIALALMNDFGLTTRVLNTAFIKGGVV